MGSIQGDLGVLGLTVVFPALMEARREGTLSVLAETEGRAFYLSPSGVYVLSAGRRRPLPLDELLARKGVLSSLQRAVATAEQKKSGRPLFEVLRDLEFVPEATIAQVMREYAQEELFEVLMETRGTFRFVEGPPLATLADPDHLPVKAPLDLNYVLLEAARRADEWETFRKAFPSGDMNFHLTPLGGTFIEQGVTDETLGRVLPLLQAGETLDSIVAETGLRRFHVWSIAFTLLNQGLIEPQTMRFEPVSAEEVFSMDTKRKARPRGQAAKENEKKTILVGDDQAPYRKIVRFLLEREGFEVVEAATGTEVLSTVESRRVDLVLLDMVLPEMEGPEICRRIKAKKKTRDVPVLFISARSLREDVLRAMQSGAQDYIIKPFKKDVLLEKIRRSVGAV